MAEKTEEEVDEYLAKEVEKLKSTDDNMLRFFQQELFGSENTKKGKIDERESEPSEKKRKSQKTPAKELKSDNTIDEPQAPALIDVRKTPKKLQTPMSSRRLRPKDV